MITRRSLEIFTALLTGAFGVAVVVSSHEVGSGWSSGGVETGTFPLIAGVFVCAGSLFNLARAFSGPSPIVLRAYEIRRLAGLFLPAAAFVAAIPLIGIYLATAAYLFGTLRFQNRIGSLRAALMAIATAFCLYVVFEQTFQVFMPHGLIGRAFGF